MIVPDAKVPPDTEASPTSKLISTSPSLPPPYGTYQPRCPQTSTQTCKFALKRFCKALCVAAIIFFLLSTFFGTFPLWYIVGWDYDIPSGMVTTHCSEAPNATSYELPINSTALFLVGRGFKSSGSLHVVQSSDVGETVQVEVTAKADVPRALYNAKSCELEGRNGEHAVGMFTPIRPGWAWWGDPVFFSVKLTFPASMDPDSPLSINKFETDLHRYSHHISKLSGGVTFDKFGLRSSDMSISVESVSATHAFVKTSNAQISGSFEASASLNLRTSKAGVDAKATLRSNNSHSPTKFSVKTNHGFIKTAISLVSPPSEPGSFSVRQMTSYNFVDTLFPTSPPNSTLTLKIKNSHAPVRALMDPAFEGGFILRTSNAKPELVVREDVEDPSGLGRTREVESRRDKMGSLSGYVYWDGVEGLRHARGSIDVCTSYGPITLTL